jgi:geranylgeranyl diphosphate synthase type II
MLNLAAYLEERRAAIEQTLQDCLSFPDEKMAQQKIHEAMRYSVFAGGKRLRPILCMAAAAVAGGSEDDVLPAACAVELVHTYSLIHDDLPCMDDDDYRRGRLTSHKVFGENMAVLAGDALLTLAFEVISRDQKEQPSLAVLQAVRDLAQAAGSEGMIGGQVMDILSENQILSQNELQQLDRLKTGALIRVSLKIGALLAGAAPDVVKALCRYGDAFGLAFQITDDILDAVGDAEKMGKMPGADVKLGKATYATILGLERARELAAQSAETAKAALKDIHGDTAVLWALADYVMKRES